MNRTDIVEAMAKALAYVEEKAGYPDHDAEGVWLRLRESNRSYWRESAEAALTAIEALEMVVVPRVATEAMVAAYVDAPAFGMIPEQTEAHAIWTAMLTAAQTKGQDID